MAKRSSSKKRTTSKAKKGQQSKGINLGKFTLGLIILIALGYGFLAIQEGKLVPDSISNLELPDFSLDKSNSPDLGSTEKKEAKKEIPRNEGATVDVKPFDYSAYDLYFTKAFDFMWPAYKASEAIVERPYYTLRYSEPHEQAIWVAYKLVADSLEQKKFPRKDDFRKDPRIKTGSATLADYRNSGYDRGHLAPAADFSYDEFGLSQTFYMSNMSPQFPTFNRGIWKSLEEQVRDWALENGEVYVVTGPVLNKNNYKTIGKNGVSIPEQYYKIILDVKEPQIKAIAFLMKNERSTEELSTFIVSIDEIERLTGLDFFPSMPDEMEDYIEALKQSDGWF